MLRQKEEAARERKERLVTEQKPIMSELRQVGVDYAYLGDMMISPIPYPSAIPLLLKHWTETTQTQQEQR